MHQFEFEDDNDEEKAENKDMNKIVEIRNDNVLPISELGSEIKFVKTYGNKLFVIAHHDNTKGTLTVFDTNQSDYLIQKQLIEKKGK